MLLLDGQKTVCCPEWKGIYNLQCHIRCSSRVSPWPIAVPDIYINDSVDSAVKEGNCITLYADDMLLYKIVNNPQDFICVQQGINNVGHWVTGSNLQLNPAK